MSTLPLDKLFPIRIFLANEKYLERGIIIKRCSIHCSTTEIPRKRGTKDPEEHEKLLRHESRITTILWSEEGTCNCKELTIIYNFVFNIDVKFNRLLRNALHTNCNCKTCQIKITVDIINAIQLYGCDLYDQKEKGNEQNNTRPDWMIDLVRLLSKYQHFFRKILIIKEINPKYYNSAQITYPVDDKSFNYPWIVELNSHQILEVKLCWTKRCTIISNKRFCKCGIQPGIN